jgi:hypothetical protein
VRPGGNTARSSRVSPGRSVHDFTELSFRALSGQPSSPRTRPDRGRYGPRVGAPWRGGRVVECTALEMRHRCKPIGGSNPSLSAILLKYNENIRFPMVDSRIASGRDRVRKASVVRSEIRSRAELNCALPLFLHPSHQRDTAHRPIGTDRLRARRRFGYWGEQIGQTARSEWSPFRSAPAELEPATAG